MIFVGNANPIPGDIVETLPPLNQVIGPPDHSLDTLHLLRLESKSIGVYNASIGLIAYSSTNPAEICRLS